ncbi:MAG: ATP-binding protein, partial [Cyanobacteriota bacterium]|nr:ATP-binding protein [Cyanobacteriota bacterium]
MKFPSVFPRLLSLRVILTAPLVLQLLIATGGVVVFVNYGAEKSVNRLATALLEEVGGRLRAEIDRFLARPIAITQEHQTLIDLGLLNLEEMDAWGPYLYQQYFNSRKDYLTGLLIGNQAKEFRAAGHTYLKNGKRIEGIARAGMTTGFRYYGYLSLDDYQKNHNPVLINNQFNVVTRPWYKAVAQNQKMQWISVFNRITHQKSLAINFSRPLYSSDRSQFLGVSSIQLDLLYLNQYLKSLKISPNAQVFILDNQERLIANSDGENQVKIINNQAVPLLASQSSNLLTQSIARRLSSSLTLKNAYSFSFLFQNKTYFILAIPLRQENGLNWLAVATIPESDFLGTFWSYQRLSLIFSALTLILAVILGLISAHYLTQPILQLGQAALALAQGRWQGALRPSPVAELNTLAQAFNEMGAQLKAYVRQLEDKEQQLRQFLEAVPIGIIVYNLQKERIFINDYATKLLASKLDFFSSVIDKTLVGQSIYTDALSFKKEEKNIPVEQWTAPIYDDEGNIIFALVMFQDIQQRKQAEKVLKNYSRILSHEVSRKTQELAQAKDKAEAANRAKGLFLANMSHELKTPLHAILGFAGLIAQDSQCADEWRTSLNMILKSGSHLLLLINNILDLAKIESGMLSIQLQSVNLSDFLREIMDVFQPGAQEKNLNFSLDYLTPCPQLIEVDVTKLRQILFNLLSNAFKFTALGEIRVIVSCQYLEHQKACLSFSVEDTGAGIGENEQALLFQPFYRGKNIDPLIEGTGLGLTLTRQYIELLGGKITLISKINQGTQVQFSLPVAVLDFTPEAAPVSAFGERSAVNVGLISQ